MAFTNKYINFINPASVIKDAASENLTPASVWLQHIIRQEMPKESQYLEVIKKGRLGRLALPENTQYTPGAYSEYLETSVLLNPIKSVVISKLTLEAEKFGRASRASVIGAEQGKALGLGMEEDIASLVSAATNEIDSSVADAQMNLHAAGFNVRTQTNGLAPQSGNMVAVLNPTSLFYAGVQSALDATTSGQLATFANPGSSADSVLQVAQRAHPQGFVANQFGLDLYVTVVVDDNGTDFQNAVFDPSRAFIGCWDDSVGTTKDLDQDYFRDSMAAYHFSDFAIYYDEAIVRLELPMP